MRYTRLLWNLLAMKRNEKKSREQMKELQEQKLRKMLAFAYENSPYYRRAFEAVGLDRRTVTTAPLSSFPKMDKALLMEHFDSLVTVKDLKQEELRRFDAETSIEEKTFKGTYHVVHSSGSTGKPGYFIYDPFAWDFMITGMLRAALWGMSMGEIFRFLVKGPRILYVAATDGRYGGAMAVYAPTGTAQCPGYVGDPADATIEAGEKCYDRFRSGSKKSRHLNPIWWWAILPPSRSWVSWSRKEASICRYSALSPAANPWGPACGSIWSRPFTRWFLITTGPASPSPSAWR